MASTAARPRRRATRIIIGGALVGVGVLASCDLANAAQLTPPEPSIFLVDGREADESRDGTPVFTVAEWNVGIQVAGASGDPTVADEQSGDVLCEVPDYTLAGSGACPAFLGPGEHRVVAAVTSGGETRTSSPVIVESYAEEDPDDGAAPSPITVRGTAPGSLGGRTAVTFAGAPGDHYVLRDDRAWEIASGTFPASGTVTEDVSTGDDTVRVQAESHRSGQRLVDTLEVVGDPAEVIRATPLELVEVVAAATTDPFDHGKAEAVVRGTPGAWYRLQQHGSQNTVTGTVPEDGLIHWTVFVPSKGVDASWQTQGDDGAQLHGTFRLVAPGDGGPAPEPVVAQPNPGTTDPGFTHPGATTEPVVAQPDPGTTDPGFTAPGSSLPGQPGGDQGGTTPPAPHPGAEATAQVHSIDAVRRTGTLRVADPAAGASSYDAQVRIDGRHVDTVRVRSTPTERRLAQLGGRGDHTLELVVDGAVVARTTYRIPSAAGDGRPTASAHAEMSDVNALTRRGTLRVSDPAATGEYTAQVWIDGALVDAVRVAPSGTEKVLSNLGTPGDHVLQLRFDTATIATVHYRVPGAQV